MKFARTHLSRLSAIVGLVLFASVAFAEGKVITTILADLTPAAPGLLRIAADGSAPIKSTHTASVSFNLGLLPAGATIINVTLQVVAKPTETKNNPQLVKIFSANSEASVGTWTATTEKRNFQVSTSQLRRNFQVSTSQLRLKFLEALIAKKALTLQLSSKSRLSDWQYYSVGDYGQNSANKPRLIVEYMPPPELIAREQERDTTKTRWTFFPQQTIVSAKEFLSQVTSIISNPVFYGGGIYLFAHPSSDKTRLYALNPGGGNRWEPTTTMPGTPGSHALVTNAGWLYSVGENRIGIYSLGKTAPQAVTAEEIKDFKPALRPTLGADGSLYAMPSGTGYIYAYTTSAQESWRYPDTTKLDLASALSLSPEAGRYVYALTKVGNETRAVRIESATGQATVNKLEAILGDVNKTVKKLDLGFTEFHRPVVSKGTKQDYVILSAATAQNGMLLAQSDGAIIWWQEGPVSQPIVNRDQNVVAVQNGKLHVYAWSNGKDDGSDLGKTGCSSEDGILQTTSNLVLDGEENVYFLNGGTLYGYTKTCKNFLSQALPGLAQVSELMFALDGTLFARTANNNLYTITPNQPALTLGQDNLRTDTIYSAEAIKVLNNVKVEKAMRILLKAQTSISFGPGFKVERGASMVARTGW